MRGPSKSANPETCFVYWYDGGSRRTKQETADHFGLSYSTIRNYANEFDWDARADEIDAETRREVNRKLARLNAKALERELTMIVAVEQKFLRRLSPTLPDGSPNPDYLPDAAIEVSDVLAAIKARLQIAEGIREPVVVGGEQREKTLEELDAEIAALDAAEQAV